MGRVRDASSGRKDLFTRVCLVGLAGLTLAACLPSSRRGETTTLLPSDSLSRRIAAGVPVDTLELVWRSEPEGFELPTSVAWIGGDEGDGGGRLVVSDTRAGRLRLLDAATGSAAGRPGVALRFPYVAGAAGDTVVVLVRGDDRLVWVTADDGVPRVTRSIPVPAGATAAVPTSSGAWVKRADEYEAWLVRIDGAGRPVARYALPGPAWRRIGFLRSRGDTLLSLSGYRPVIDVLAPDAPAGASPDTLALVGFDSPQLIRSHRYILGEVDQPPLLTSSAAVLEDRLFVLNLRGDHVRVDVFGRDGRLERSLVYPTQDVSRDHFPVDLCVREGRRGISMAVVMQSPGGVLSDPGGYVLMLRWPGSEPPS